MSFHCDEVPVLSVVLIFSRLYSVLECPLTDYRQFLFNILYLITNIYLGSLSIYKRVTRCRQRPLNNRVYGV